MSQTKRAKFIINPSSGRQSFKGTIETIIGRLVRKGVANTIDVFLTEKKYDAFECAKSIKEDEYDFIVSVGGDGTLNEVASGIVHSGSRVPLAIISAGTVNDYATYLKLPHTADKFVKMIQQFQIRPVDICKANENYFMNVAAAGIMTDIGYKVDKDAKAFFGKMAYYMNGALELPKQLFSDSMILEISCDGATEIVEGLVFLAANSPSVGGFKDMCPEAEVDDGLLDFLVLKKSGLPELMGVVFQTIGRAAHINNSNVIYVQTDRLSIKCLNEPNIKMDLDGESCGTLPVDLEVIPKAINLLVP